MAKKRLGELLLALKAKTPASMPSLSAESVEQALATQALEGGRLGEILVKMRAITEEDLLQALGLQIGIPYSADIKVDDVDIDLATSIPIGFAKQHRLLVLKRDGDSAMVATGDPLEMGAFDDLRMQLSLDVQPILVPAQRILEVINDVYGRKADKGGDLGKKEDEEDEGSSEELVDILEITDEAPIIRWVNSLLFNAVKERASDIHIEPGEKEVLVRYRIDGELYETRRAARQFMPSIISRVKIMAGLNIAEKRLPQDGRIRRKIAGKDIDMRVATAPTVKQGERITIRLLDRESVLHDLADIGFGDDHLRQMDDLIHKPHGIMLVTGPTGSGKTTTLYACLAKINAPDLNILTIEDPVEYQLDGISQTAVNEKIELTFAAGLRSFLRHDPDVIMVGEIRDRDTVGDRDPGVADRPPGAVDDPHQRRRRRDHASRRSGRAAVPGRVVADGAAGAAAGAARLPRVPRAVPPGRRGPGEHRHRSGGVRARRSAPRSLQGRRGLGAAARDAVPREGGRLHRLPGRRLQGPDGDLRAADHRREDPPAHHQERGRAVDQEPGHQVGDADVARGRRPEGAGRHDHHRRGPDDHDAGHGVTGDAGLRLEGPEQRRQGGDGDQGRRRAEGPAPDAAQGRHLRHRAQGGAGRRRRAPGRRRRRVASGEKVPFFKREIDLGGLLERVRPQDVAVLTRQLATLLKAGIPLAEALAALGEQADNKKLAMVLVEVREKVTQGTSLADTLGAYPNIFPDLYVNMVRSGEAAGNLDAVLLRLADFMDAQNALRAKVTGALTYPILMMILGAIVMGILMVVVVPKITAVFEDLEQGAALEHGAADLRLRRRRQLLVGAHRLRRSSATSASSAGRASRRGARSSIGSSCACG